MKPHLRRWLGRHGGWLVCLHDPRPIPGASSWVVHACGLTPADAWAEFLKRHPSYA
jgi:hypothetical protein